MHKRIVVLLVLILAGLTIALGLSYSFFTSAISGSGSTLTIKAGDLDLTLTNTKVNPLSIEPIYESEVSSKAYTQTFTITRGSEANLEGCYDVYIVIDNIGEGLKSKYLKYRISDGTYTREGNFAPSNFTYVNNKATIKVFSNHEISTDVLTHSYTLMLWLVYDPLVDQSTMLTGNDNSRTIEAHIEASGSLGRCTVNNNKYLVDEILKNKTIETRDNFTEVFTDNTDNKIFTTDRTEDDSVVYYYAGNTHNNWVVFGNNGSATNPVYYYWRIIRTNSNEEGGGVRLLYSGSGTSATSIPSDLSNGFAFTSAFNNSASTAEGVGYMFTNGEQHGNSNSSTLKTAIENWYTTSNLSSYEDYINADAVYCSDRTVPEGVTWTSTPVQIPYSTTTRLHNDRYATYKCGGNAAGGYYESESDRLADRYSKTINGGGNGLLLKPIATVTADELVFAGGAIQINLTSPYAWYYVNDSGESITGTTRWRTLTPNTYYEAYSKATSLYVFTNTNPGWIDACWLSGSCFSDEPSLGVRPVISLKEDALITGGDGRVSSPYTVSY